MRSDQSISFETSDNFQSDLMHKASIGARPEEYETVSA